MRGRRRADLDAVHGDEGVGPHVHELDPPGGQIIDQLGQASGVGFARIVERNRRLQELDPARAGRFPELLDVDDGVLLQGVVDHSEAREVPVGEDRFELGSDRCEKRGPGDGASRGLEALDDPCLERVGDDREHAGNAFDMRARLRPFPRTQDAERSRSAEGMNEVGLGGANLFDDSRNPTPVPRDVEMRVLDPDTPLAHVGAETVLDVRLSPPGYEKDVEGFLR